MYGMFDSCKLLTGLDLSNFDTRSVKNTHDMFCRWKNDAVFPILIQKIMLEIYGLHR